MNESPWEQAVRLTQAAMRTPEIKRFYEAAAVGEVDGGYALLLDGRGARTPAKNKLVAPTRAIAEAIAAEWAGQGAVVDPTSMPVTRLANSAIDGVAQHPRRDQSRHCALRRRGLALLSRRGARGARRDAGRSFRSGPRLGARTRWARGSSSAPA